VEATFHFVTDGIHAALERAVKAAKGQDVRLAVASLQSSHTFAQALSTKCT
jgi:hypothetical protein